MAIDAAAEPMPDESDGEDTSEQEGGDDAEYAMAGRAIRHAITDGDDAGLAEAICHLIDLHTGEDEGSGEEPESGKRPDLAILLAKKPK